MANAIIAERRNIIPSIGREAIAEGGMVWKGSAIAIAPQYTLRPFRPDLATDLFGSHLAAMVEWLIYEWEYHVWAVVAVVASAIAAISIWADWRRQKRKTIGQVSYVPWTGISMLAVGVTLIAAALAVKMG